MADWTDRLHGGRADDAEPADFDPEELALGVDDEREHTDDPHIPWEIAMDHLAGDPEYYTHLKSAGIEDESPAPRSLRDLYGEDYHAPDSRAHQPLKHHEEMIVRRYTAALVDLGAELDEDDLRTLLRRMALEFRHAELEDELEDEG